MRNLLFVHVLSVLVWFGTAAAQAVMELSLWRTSDGGRQRALLDLRQRLDMLLGGPAFLGAVVTGLILMQSRGYFRDTVKWPAWFEDMVICAVFVVAANLLCLIFAFIRGRRVDAILGRQAPLDNTTVRKWSSAILATFVAIPFAVATLWLATVKP